jgi:uncharacterized protein with ParB-like and HNH nuclease domain
MASGQYINTTVSDIINNYINDNTYLPAIQREYVWSTEQICKLFDSLMCGYPISSFLFWKIREEDKKKWTAYEFLRDYDKNSTHNKEANFNGVNKDIYLVLDGQQRMTSLNIGLKGSYSYFHYKKRKEYLYINLLHKVDETVNPDELRYSFAFKESDKAYYSDSNEFWYKVGEILNHDRPRDAKNAIWKDIECYDNEQQKIIENNIEDLHNMVHTSQCINFYEEKTKDYDKVVEMFVRTNTGGIKLEYSDILLSTATAKWKNLNAREEIYSFTDSINKINPGYGFGKDFVMKGAMYLTPGLPIQYKVSSFTRENLEKIEANWDTIKDAISKSIQLLSSFGFSDKNIVSKNAVLPIAYYLARNPVSNYINSSESEAYKDKKNIQTWFILNTIRNVFSGSSDTTLRSCQEVLNINSRSFFPYKQLNDKISLESKLGDAEIENYLLTTYSTRYSFLLLSLLYPDRDWLGKKYNEDHIFPQTEFTRSKLIKRGYSTEKIDEYIKYFNTILNLELLEESENKSKNATPFDKWVNTRDNNFKRRHFIPDMDTYDFDHFIEFIQARKILMKKTFKSITFE